MQSPQEKSGEVEAGYRSFVIRVQPELWVSQGYFMLLGDKHFPFMVKDANEIGQRHRNLVFRRLPSDPG